MRRQLYHIMVLILPGVGENNDYEQFQFFYEDFRLNAPGLLRFGVSASTFFFSVLALLKRGRPPSLMSREQKESFARFLGKQESFLFRQSLAALKLVTCFFVFRDPVLREALNQGGLHERA